MFYGAYQYPNNENLSGRTHALSHWYMYRGIFGVPAKANQVLYVREIPAFSFSNLHASCPAVPRLLLLHVHYLFLQDTHALKNEYRKLIVYT